MGRGFKGFYEYCSIIEILAAKSFRHFAEGIIMKLPEMMLSQPIYL